MPVGRQLSRYLLIAFGTLMAVPAFADCRSALDGRELVWAWNEWVPYSYADQSGQPIGFDVDLVSRILDEAGCPYRFVNQPARRAQQGLRDGSVDMMAAASITPERELFSRFSQAYRDERIVLFALAGRADALTGLTLDDTAERRLHLAAGLGGWYGKAFEAHSADLQKAGLLVLTSDLEGRLRMLSSTRVDLVIEDQVAGIATARQLGLEHRLAVLPNPMNSDPVSLMFSRQSVPAEVVMLVDQAIERLKQSPDYQQIIDQYTKLSN